MEAYEARLGDEVEDRVSGFTGVVTSLHRFLQGCDRMSVQPPTDEDGKFLESASFDAPDLMVIKKQVFPCNGLRDKNYTGDVLLGDMVCDPISGFTGVAVTRHVYPHSCDRISVQPRHQKDTAMPDYEAFDAPQLKVTERGYVKYETPAKEPPGGPPKFMPEPRESDGRRID